MSAVDVSSPDAVAVSLNKLLKPGTKTSEFIAMIAVWAGSLATLLGAFNTANPKFNAILKVAALVAVAVSHVGYALSRGNVKNALGGVAQVMIENGWVVPTRTQTKVSATVDKVVTTTAPADTTGQAAPQDSAETSSSGHSSYGTAIWILAVVGIVLVILILAGVFSHR